MKTHIRTVLLAAATVAAFSAIGIPTAASAADCVSIIARCAIELGGKCERVGNMEHTLYLDKPGGSSLFEACVSERYKAAGLPDPYAVGGSHQLSPERVKAPPAAKPKR
jgi:hypothetical protein